MNSLLRVLMSSDADTTRAFPSLLLLGIFDFCCILIGLESINDHKILRGSIWILVGIVSGLIGYSWSQMKKWRGRKTEIEFLPGIDPFVQTIGTDYMLYRVAVKSKGAHSGVSLVVSNIIPQPPGSAVTEIPLIQRHDRPQLNIDGKWKKTFDLHQEQPIYIDVVQKTRNEESIWVVHGMPDHIDPRIPVGNYTLTLETRGPVVSRRKFIVTVDSDGVLGFKPL